MEIHEHMSPFEISTPISDPLIKRNYKLIGNYLVGLLDKGLDFLKKYYVEQNSETTFQEFAADNYYDYILRDYLKRKIKTQIKFILRGAIACLDHYKDNLVDSIFLDDLIANIFSEYQDVDLVLLHSDHSHPAYPELEILSRLTLRVAILQIIPLLANPTPNIQSEMPLILSAFPDEIATRNSIDAIFSMFDQIIDVFERNLKIINIPFYRPTYRIRNFDYARHIYEFALERAREEITQLFKNADKYEVKKKREN